MYEISVTPLDAGFDVRALSTMVRLGGGLNEALRVKYLDAEDRERFALGPRESVAEELARAGYSVAAFLTPDGRDVRVTPTDLAPPGDGFTGRLFTWAVQPARDNYWCRGASLLAAVERSGRSLADLSTLAESR